MPQRPSPPDALRLWTAVDDYFGSLVLDRDPALDAAISESRAAGLPDIQVSPLQGKLLQLLARAIGARRILEIGTLGGYSAIWLARALPADGRLVTLELEPDHARIARSNLGRAGLLDRVEVLVGPARESLRRLSEEGAAPFDLVFIDADKPSYPEYLDGALRLTHRGSLIVADNVVRRGDVIDAESVDAMVQGVRRMNERLGRDPRVNATVMQTVGVKGHDGFALALVVGDREARASGPPAAPITRR